MHTPKQHYMVVFDLIDATLADYEAVYRSVHAEGGYHYVRDERGWGRLPQRTVVLPLAAGWHAACARVAFELLLAKLDLVAASIAVIAGEPAVDLARLAAAPPLFAHPALRTTQPQWATGAHN